MTKKLVKNDQSNVNECGHGLSITRTVKATASKKLTVQSCHGNDDGNGHRHGKVQSNSKSLKSLF
jgi:hypothetical protein